jgi:TetR/AcrR family transcriptional repressor of nem operon
MTIETSVGQKQRRPRGRPRRFTIDVVVSKVKACFAQRGYAGTSISDLEEATGLSSPSLYNSFGDKRTMFLQCLDSEYEDLSSRLNGLNLEDPLPTRLSRFLGTVVDGYPMNRPNPGIAFGAALSEVTSDPEVQQRLRRFDLALDSAARSVLGDGERTISASLLSAVAIGLCIRSQSSASSSAEIDVRRLACLLASEV